MATTALAGAGALVVDIIDFGPNAVFTTSLSHTVSSGLNNGLESDDDGACDVCVARECADCVASEWYVPHRRRRHLLREHAQRKRRRKRA